MLLSFAVSATDIQLTWDRPEVREDGSEIQTIDRFNLYHTANDGSANIIEIDSTLSSYQITDVEEGVHIFQISTVEAGLEGDPSDFVSIGVKQSKPVKILLQVQIIGYKFK